VIKFGQIWSKSCIPPNIRSLTALLASLLIP